MNRRSKFFTKKKSVLVGLLLLAIGFRLYLPTLARDRIKVLLNGDPLYHGNVEAVRISLWRGAYGLLGLTIERVEGQKRFPLLAADDIDIGVSWKELIRGAVRAKLDVRNLVVNVVREKKQDGPSKVALGRDSKEGRKEEAHGWQATFRALVPIDVERLRITGESIHYRDLSSSPELDLFLDRLRVRAENLTNSAKLSRSSQPLFGTVDLRARVMKSGELQMALETDPLASPPEFKITAHLKGLDLVRLNDFFRAYGSFDVKSGRLDAVAELASADGNFEGYLKPFMRGLAVADLKKDLKKGGVFHAVWEVIVGALGGILKSHGTQRQAARIAFSGRLDAPNTSPWQTIKSVLYNAFVKPISPAVEGSVKLEHVERAVAGQKDQKK